MTPAAGRRFPLSGRQVAAVLAAVVLATAVVPPGAAWWLNERRIEQTRARVAEAADRLRARATDVAAAAGAVGIACGPGRLPDIEPASSSVRRAADALRTHQAWVSTAARAPGLFDDGMRADGWGRCFLLNVRDWASGGPVWLLSAGPNGVVDTPATALETGGDDIGQRVR